MSTRLPPLLEPYLALPPETALIVLTSVLGASTNWLVLRYLHTLLNPRPSSSPAPHTEGAGEEASDHVSVLLVSFLRDYAFWRDSAARAGVDLDAAGRRGRFGFVDGLGMFLPRGSSAGGKAEGEGEGEGQGVPWRTRVGSARLADVGGTLAAAVDALRARGAGRVVLVVDQLDLLLATAGAEEGGAEGLRAVLLDLREVCTTVGRGPRHLLV